MLLFLQGDIVVVGGHVANAGYADGLKSIRIFNTTTMTLTKVRSKSSLLNNR